MNVYNKTRSEIIGKERTDIRDYPEKACENGTGIPRIFENYKNTKRQPVIDVFDGAFRITLPNVNYIANENPKLETTSTVETYAKLILEFLSKNEYVTKESAANVFGVKPARAYVILEELAKGGVVKVAKMGRSKIYLKG